MKYHTIPLGIVLTFSVLFTASSGVLKGQAFASIEEEIDDYYQNQYDKNTLYETNRGSDDLSFPIDTPRIIREILEGVDRE